MITPDGLPTLARGAHTRDSGEACIMELVAFLAGEAWSDKPKCVHPLLGHLARATNDILSADDRHLLVPAITRLFGTDDERATEPLERYIWEAYGVDIPVICSSNELIPHENFWDIAYCIQCALAPMNGFVPALSIVRLLMGALDVYDEATGRNTTTVTLDQAKKASAQIRELANV